MKPKPNMTAAELAAWESMARDGSLRRYALGRMSENHTSLPSDDIYEEALQRRIGALRRRGVLV